jgi:hypothetical protein
MGDGGSRRIAESLLEAFSLTWEMYRDAIEGIPEGHWRTGDVDYLIPSRLVLHAIEAVDGYFSPPGGFTPGHRFGTGRWEAAPPERLPSKDQARAYLREVWGKTEAWLGALDDSDLLSPETEYPWTGGTLLGRALYALAHSRQHLGEVNAELRRRGLPRVKWRTF